MIQTENYHIKLNKVIAFILTVIFLAVACSLALISGSHSLTNTYDAGEVCDVRNGSANISLDPTGDNNYFWAATAEEPFAWNYFYINITDTSFEETEFTVRSFSGGEVVGDDINCTLENGFNEIRLSGDECDSLQVIAAGDEPVSFTAGVMEFRENKVFFSMSRYLLYVAGFASLFALAGGVFIWWMRKKRYRIDWYAPIDFLQDVYITFGNRLAGVSSKVPPRVKHVLRVAALICWLFWIMMMYNTGKYVLSAYFKYNVLLFCIVMLLYAISLLEKPLTKKDWNTPLVHAWFWLSICMCVSEFFISKRFCMIGYVNLTAFGFYYFVLSNLRERKPVVREIMLSFKLAFFISFLFTLAARPRDPLYGLMGHTWNPNIYGIFCGIVLLAFLASIRSHMIRGRYGVRFFVNVAGAMASLSFVMLAGSRAGMLLIVPGVIFFMVEYISIMRKGIVRPLKGISLGLLSVIVFYGMHVFLSWATIYLPVIQVVFAWDDAVPSEVVRSIISVGMETPTQYSIMFGDSTTQFLTGRNLYWAEYFREINFLGHEYYPKMWGAARNPHNGVLGIIYRYGVLAAVPYIVMFINACTISFKRYVLARSIDSYSFYIWISIIGITLCMLIENFERPFLATEWLWWYWCLGFLFMKKGDVGERMRRDG